MINPDLPTPPDYGKWMVLAIVAAIGVASAGYLGYRQFQAWHEKEVQTAISREKQKTAKVEAALEKQIRELRDQAAAEKEIPVPEPLPEAAPAVSNERMAEVFGLPTEDAEAAPDSAEPSCDDLKNRVFAFFHYVGRRPLKKLPPDWADALVRDISAAPPLVVDEMRSMETLKKNTSHFFRVLKKDRLNLVKTVLQADKDVLEQALSDAYQYYVTQSCCKPGEGGGCASLKTLYEYVGFFTTTLSGKSYLLRRDSLVRCLTEYYCVLILDHANDAELNRYGIDIRPQIDLALEAVSHRSGLVFQNRYVETLTRLKAKYAPKPVAGPPGLPLSDAETPENLGNGELPMEPEGM